MRSKEPSEWRMKVGESLLELAAIYKEYVKLQERLKRLPPSRWREVLGDDPDEGTKRHAAERLNQLVSPLHATEQETQRDAFYALSLSAIEKKPIEISGLQVFYDGPPIDNPARLWLLNMMEFLAEHRCGRPLYQLVAEDRAGVKDSSEKMQRIMQDAHKLRYGEPIKPTKGKVDHRVIFDFGMRRGLEKLTAEELAYFFDEFCPFCLDKHDPDALRRQRKAFEEQRRKALDWQPVGLDSTGY